MSMYLIPFIPVRLNAHYENSIGMDLQRYHICRIFNGRGNIVTKFFLRVLESSKGTSKAYKS